MGAKGCRGLSGRTRATSKSGDGKSTFSDRGRTLCLRKLTQPVTELGDKQCRLPRDKSLGLVELKYRESSTVVERGSHRQNNF